MASSSLSMATPTLSMKYARIRSFADRRSSPMSERAEIARSFTRWRTFTKRQHSLPHLLSAKIHRELAQPSSDLRGDLRHPGRVGLLVMSGGCSDGFPLAADD